MFGIFVFLIASAGCSESFVLDENSNKLYDFDWQCDTICLGSGGKANFDAENKICKCTLDKNTDEINIPLMEKNARNMGLEIITCEEYKDLQKRDLSETVKHLHEETVSKKRNPKINLKKFKPLIPNSGKFKNPFLEPKKKFELPSTRKTFHNLPDSDAKKRIKEMHEKFRNKMGSRTWKLPTLKQRSAFKEASGKSLFNIKKIKNGEKKMWGSKLNNIVGQPVPNINEEEDNQSNKLLVGVNKVLSPGKYVKISNEPHHIHISEHENPQHSVNGNLKHEIMTQPSNLYNTKDNTDDGDNKQFN